MKEKKTKPKTEQNKPSDMNNISSPPRLAILDELWSVRDDPHLKQWFPLFSSF